MAARSVVLGSDWDHDPLWVPQQMADALVAKMTGSAPPGSARMFHGIASFRHLAHACAMIGNRDRGRMPNGRIVLEELSLGKSDFPNFVSDTFRKILLQAYKNANPTFRRIAREVPLRDFKPHAMVAASAFPNLIETPEHCEFKVGPLGDRGEAITAATFGRIVALTRALIVNEDLNLFSQLATLGGQRAADFANQLFYTLCINPGAGFGPDLSDGDPVYDANHANIAGAGALDATTLSSARSLLRSQVTSDGLKLNTSGRYLLVSPESETLAEQLIEGLHGDPIEVIADSNLSGKRFYLLADPAQLANYTFGFPLGREPEAVSRVGFDIDGLETRVSLSIGVGATDWLGGVSGVGQ